MFDKDYWLKWAEDHNILPETMLEWFRDPLWICPECGYESDSKRPIRDKLPLVCLYFPKCPGIMLPKVEHEIRHP